jgi:hypothetical protein
MCELRKSLEQPLVRKNIERLKPDSEKSEMLVVGQTLG